MGFVTWLPWVSLGFRYECAATRRRLATASAVVCFCGIVTGRPGISSRGVHGLRHGGFRGFQKAAISRTQWPSSVAVISGRHHQSLYHQWPSSVAVIIRAFIISGRHQWPSSVAVISGLHQWPIISYNQRSSEVIRGHQRPSEVIRGHQRNSVALVPAVSPRTPMVDVREGQARCPLVTAMPARPAGTWRTRAARHRAVRSPHLRPPDEEGNRRATRWTIWSSSNSNP